ncbi:hypothetical protein GCM10017056_52990 [Seohaeicola zhoushanensis]|uniref:Uncharacterized protein n=1 Tax=Seohaeicola zhoushanensis TaxID=1569283 RepID=A0A8J3H4B9_9RHOB|nr:hypothetical protein GCM10017056_52990 [Seohaeicola zhoushanensis]
MQFGNLPFRNGDYRDALKSHAFEESRNVFLISADPIQAFGYDDIEMVVPCVFKETLIAGTQVGRTADATVGIRVSRQPSVALD